MCFVMTHKSPPKIAILWQKSGKLRKYSVEKRRIYYTISFLKKQVLFEILLKTSFFTCFSHGGVSVGKIGKSCWLWEGKICRFWKRMVEFEGKGRAFGSDFLDFLDLRVALCEGFLYNGDNGGNALSCADLLARECVPCRKK